jgi:hypothetical protein
LSIIQTRGAMQAKGLGLLGAAGSSRGDNSRIPARSILEKGPGSALLCCFVAKKTPQNNQPAAMKPNCKCVVAFLSGT